MALKFVYYFIFAHQVDSAQMQFRTTFTMSGNRKIRFFAFDYHSSDLRYDVA